MKKSALSLVLLSLVILFLFAGCSGKKVETKIIVDGEEIICTAKSKNTVTEVLKANGVTVSDKDEIEPAPLNELGENTPVIYVYRNKTITVVVDGNSKQVNLTKGTVADALKKAEVTLGENDKINFEETDELTDDMEITVTRGVRVNVTVAGKKKAYVTTGKTVSAALKELKIKFDKDDIIEPARNKKITKGMNITVKKVEVKEETETKIIYYTTKTEYSDTMEKGTSKVTQNGVNGKKEVISKNTYIDGELTSSEVVEEKVISNPVNKVVVQGSKEVTTTAAKTTSPKTTAPKTTAPKTTAPKTTAPKTTVPKTTAPKTTAPKTTAPKATEKYIVQKERVEDCDGSGHGYYVITYSDGSVVYQDF